MAKPTTITLDAFIRSMSKIAERAFAQRGELSPLFVGDTPDGERVVFPVPPGLTKDLSSSLMRDIAKEHALVRCVMMDEAWLLINTNREPGGFEALKQRAIRGSIRNDPRSVEVIMFSAEDYVTGSAIGRRDIVRPAHGKPYLGKLTIEIYGDVEGRFTGLLPPRGKMQ